MDKINKIKNFFKKKNILITGNTGFIGSWLTLLLVRYGANITGISKDCGANNGLFNILNLRKKIKFYQFNLVDEKKTYNFLKKNKFDIIVHLAADPLIVDGHENPSKLIKNNILSTMNLIQNISNLKTYIVNFTTDKIYLNDNNKKNYFIEKDVLQGEDPYSFSKVCADMMTKMWVNNFKNSRCVNIRCGNVIGGGDWSKKRIIPDLIQTIFKKKKLVIRNVNSTRPWVHILEVCNIIIMLIYKNYETKKNYDEFNISPNRNEEKNIKWIINYFKTLSINDFHYTTKSEFKEKTNLKLNSTKIKKILTLNYKFNVKERFSMTFDWYKVFYKTRKLISEKTHSDIEFFESLFFKNNK